MKLEFHSLAYDFVSRLMERLEESQVRRIILFGSAARGDADSESDIDVFIDTLQEKQLSPIVTQALNEFTAHARHTWGLRGIDNPLIPIVGNLDDPRWAALRREMASSGTILFGPFLELPKNTRPCTLISYSLSRLPPKEKSRLLRRLSGYTITQRKKTYTIPGLLQQAGGAKIGRNAILVPREHQKAVLSLLASRKAGVEIRECWANV